MAKYQFASQYRSLMFTYPPGSDNHHRFRGSRFETDDPRMAKHLHDKVPDAVQINGDKVQIPGVDYAKKKREESETSLVLTPENVDAIDLAMLLPIAVERGIIERNKGGWYKYAENTLGNSPDTCRMFFANNPEVLDEVKRALTGQGESGGGVEPESE